MAIQRFEIELVSAKMIAPNVKHLVLKKADNSAFDFVAGQFITFLFDHEDGKVRRRSYSVATIKGESQYIEIAISYVDGGIATEHLFNMKPGDKFNAMGPAGRLVLKEDEKVRKLLLVGTGTGIAPYRAMLPELEKIAGNDAKEVHVLLGVQYQQDAIYAEDFRVYANKLEHLHFKACLSREENSLQADETKGYVQHQFDQLDLDPEQDVVYLCGNPNMIDQAFEALTTAGFNAKMVRREKYISSN
ncbi:FAD-binding oxidoreductase [Fangia hongkongensis]|uniref:FAD-binding oxidoreductase n=1 Tax=Fangia hongkongensis TaxID=270495 RepID=UPI00036706E6|nr:FAD-binding oxidoreductase [Fangia hongkongensis]MBK2125429.1 ferredoxin--NADP reductase [Fangia hongkongensis]